jgi:hypothetical protein
MPAKPETTGQKADSALGCVGQEPLTIFPTGGFVEIKKFAATRLR